jgi:hypothetical protein
MSVTAMKRLFVTVSLVLGVVVIVGAAGYSTTFPLTENPISESAQWTAGGAVGLDWSNVRTTPGLAFGTQTGSTNFNDSLAVLKGTWSADQSATATVRTVNQKTGSIFEEVEILLRFTITAHSATGYEFNYSCRNDGSQYVQIVRWNGAFNNWTLLDARTGPGLNNGDRIKATISGSTLTTYVNNVAIFSVNDSGITSGNPGIGLYLQGGTSALNPDFGLTSFIANGGLTAPSAPTNLRIIRF